MSLYIFLIVLVSIDSLYGETLTVGFMHYPDEKKTVTSRAVFNKYVKNWNRDHQNMQITIRGEDDEYNSTGNADVIKKLVTEDEVDIIFGFCYNISKIDEDTLDEYMHKKGVYIFCASTQDNACSRNVVNVQDGGVYYGRSLLYLTSIWKKIVIVSEATTTRIIRSEVNHVCQTQKCEIIGEIDAGASNGIIDLKNRNDDDYLIIVSASPLKCPSIYSSIKTLKDHKNVQVVGYGNLELRDAVGNADYEDSLLTVLISPDYTSEKTTKMNDLINDVVSQITDPHSQPFQYLYLVYSLFDTYLTVAERYETFNVSIILNNLYIKQFKSPISISTLIKGNVIRNSQYLYKLSSTANSDELIKKFDDFNDFHYISPWDRIGSLPVGNCDWNNNPTNGIVNGSYIMIAVIIPYSGEYENVGIYYSRIINSYIHEINKNGGILNRVVITYYIDSLSDYDSVIKTNFTEINNKYDISVVLYNTPYDVRVKLLSDFANNEILWFNLHNNGGYECEKYRYNLGFSHEQINEVYTLAFDLAQEVGRNYTFVFYSDTEEDKLIADLYVDSLNSQGTMNKQFKYPLDNITDELTSAFYGSLVFVSLSFDDTITFLEYLNNTPSVYNNIRIFFANVYEPVFDKYKESEMMKKIYLLTPFAENKGSNVMDEMKEIISNYYRFNETEVDQPIYGFMGIAYVSLRIWNETVVLTNSLDINIINDNIYKRHVKFVQGPYSIDINGYSAMNVVLERYNNESKHYEEEFSTDYAIIPLVYGNNTICDLTKIDETIYDAIFIKIFGIYTFHNLQSRYYLNQLRLAISMLNEKGGFNGYMLKLEYSAAPAFVIYSKVMENLNKGVRFFVGSDNSTILDMVIPQIEKRKAFLINPHYDVGKKCYNYVIHTGLMASQIFPRLIEVSGVQGSEIVAVSSGTREEDVMIESLEKYSKDDFGSEIIVVRKNETTELGDAIDEGLVELNSTKCSRMSCTILTLTQETILEVLKSIDRNNFAKKYGTIMVAPYLKDIVKLYHQLEGTNMALDSYFYKLTNSESTHFVQEVEQLYGPSYLFTGVTMAMYEGLKIVEKAYTSAMVTSSTSSSSTGNNNANIMENVQRMLINLEYNGPAGAITLKPNLNVERKVYIAMITGVMAHSSGGFDPQITNENSNYIYPMFGNTDVYCDWSDESILENGTYSQIKILLLNDPKEVSRNLAITGYLNELLGSSKLPETIHYQGIIRRANCPKNDLEASTILVKYSFQGFMLCICDCPLTSLNVMDNTLATLDMVFFYIRPSLRSKCSSSIWYMDVTPIQHLRPTLFWAFEKFGNKVSIMYNSDFNVENYLNLIEELCDELSITYLKNEISDDEDTYSEIIVKQLQFIQYSGFIIDLLPETLSKKYHKIYTSKFPQVVKILTFFTFTLGMMDAVTNLMTNHYFITTSYAPAITNPKYLKNAVPYMSLSYYTPPNILLAAEALESIIYIYQSYSNPTIENFRKDLIGYECNDFEGKIVFDSSHYMNRPVYAVEIIRKGMKLSYDITQISMYWRPEPFFLKYNEEKYTTCDLTQSVISYEKNYIKIGVIQSFTGQFADSSRGLAAVITSLASIVNENGGVNGYFINCIVKNDESDVNKIPDIIDSFKSHEVTFVFGLTDSSLRIKALPLIEERLMVLYYPATTTEANECSRNVFSTGMMTNDLLSLPYLLRSNFSTTRAYLVVMSSEETKFEVQMLQDRFELFGIKLVGKYFVYTQNTDFKRVAKIISNSLGTGGVIVSILKGSLAMELFKGCYGVIRNTMTIIATGVNEYDLNSSGFGYTAVGHYIWLSYVDPEKTSKYYYYYDVINKKITYKTSFNELHANTYNAFELWYNSAKKAKSFELMDVIKAGEGLEFDSISGRLIMDYSHYLYGRATIRKVELDRNSNRYVLINLYPNMPLNYKTFVFNIFDEYEVKICDWRKGGEYKPDFVKIGLLYDVTGTSSNYELISGMSAISAIMTINEEGGLLDGIYVVPVLRNTKSDSLIPMIVNEFIRDPKIIAIMGGKSEEARIMVSNALQNSGSNLLFFTPAKTLGNECNLDVVQVGSTMNQFCDPILNYVLLSDAIPYMYIIEGETGISDVFKAILLEQYKPFINDIKVIMGNDATISSMEVARTVFNYIPEKGLIFSLLTTNYHLQLLEQIRNNLHIDLTKYYFFGLVPDTKDTVTNPSFENTYFFISYDIFSTNPLNIKLLQTWQRHSLTTFISEDAYNSYLAVEYIRAAVEKGNSIDRLDLRENLINLRIDSPNGEIEILPNYYSSHHISVGYMSSDRKFVTEIVSSNDYLPVAFLWYSMDSMGYKCDVTTGSNEKLPQDYGFLLYCATTTGKYQTENVDIPIVLSQLIQITNRDGGIMGKKIIIQYFDDQSDEETCGSRLYNTIEELKSKLIGIIYGAMPSCLTHVKSTTQKLHVPIFVYTHTEGETCDSNIMYFDVEPSFYERAYQMFLTRNYKKFAIVGGLPERYSHVIYSNIYLSNFFQSVKIIGNITKENVEEISQKIKDYLGDEFGAVLYFGLDSTFHPLLDTFDEDYRFLYNFIAFDIEEMEGDYDYDIFSSYSSKIDNEENELMVSRIQEYLRKKPNSVISKLYSIVMSFDVMVEKCKSFAYEELFETYRQNDIVTPEGILKLSSSNYVKFYFRISRHSQYGVDLDFTSTDLINPNPYKYLSNEATYYVCTVTKTAISKKLPKNKYTINVIIHYDKSKQKSTSVIEGAILAQEEINAAGGTLGYYVAVNYYNMDNEDSYSDFQTSIRLNKNIYIVGFADPVLMKKILVFLNDTDEVFFSSSTLTEAYCVNNLITTEMTAPQISNFLAGAVIQMKPIVFLICDKDKTSESYIITTRYLKNTLEYYGINVVSVTEVDKEMSDLTQFWANSKMIQIRKGIIITTVGDIFDLYLLKSFKDQEFDINEIQILFTDPISDFFTDFSLIEDLYGHLASGSFLDGIHQKDDSVDVDIPTNANKFMMNLMNHFGISVTADSVSESSYTSIYYIHNTISYTRTTNVKDNVMSLSEVVIESASGKTVLDKSRSLARRLFIVKFTYQGPALYYSPNTLTHSSFYADYYNLTDIEICDFNPKTNENSIVKNVVVLHLIDQDSVNEETSISRTIDLFISKTETDFKLKGYELSFRNVYSDEDNIKKDLSKAIKDYNPIALLGGREPFILPIIEKLTKDTATPYFYYGLDDTSVCRRNFFYFQSDYYQRFFVANQYVMNLTFIESVILFDNEVDNILDDINDLFNKNKSPLLSAINITTEEGLKSVATILPSLLATKLSHIAIYVLVQGKKESKLRDYIMENKKLLDSSNYLFIFRECNPFYWTAEQYSFFNGHMCIDTISNSEDSTETTVFRTEAHNLFGNGKGDSEINSLVYSSLFLLGNAINNVMAEHTGNSFPNADYINQALKVYKMPIPNGPGRIDSSGMLITTYFIKSVSQYGFDSVEYPTNGLIYINPEVDCNLGKLVEVYTYPTSLIACYLIYVIVVLYLISVFYVYTKNRHNPIVRNTSYLFSVIAMFALFLLSSCSMIVLIHPENDFTCNIRKWFILISLDLLLSTFVMKVWRIHKLMNNKQLNKMRIGNMRLLMVIACVIVIQLVYLLIWTLAAPVHHQKELNVKLSDFITDVYVRNCEAEEYFLIVEAIGILALAGWGVQVAFKIRNVVAEFNESLSLISTIVILCIWTLAMLALDFAFSDEPTALAFIRTIGINLGVFVVAFIQFGNKVSLLYCTHINDGDDSSSSEEGEGRDKELRETDTVQTPETSDFVKPIGNDAVVPTPADVPAPIPLQVQPLVVKSIPGSRKSSLVDGGVTSPLMRSQRGNTGAVSPTNLRKSLLREIASPSPGKIRTSFLGTASAQRTPRIDRPLEAVEENTNLEK